MGIIGNLKQNAARDAEIHSGKPCPVCGKGTIPGDHFCYNCSSFLDETGTRALTAGEVPEEELERRVSLNNRAMQDFDNDPQVLEIKRNMKLCMVAMVVGIILTFIGSIGLGMLLTIGSVIMGVTLQTKLNGKIPSEHLNSSQFEVMVSKYLTPHVLDEVFDKVEEFEPRGHISYTVIQDSGLVHKSYNRHSGNHRISGIYKGVPLEMSNIYLTNETPGDEDNEPKVSVSFNGVWLSFRLNTRFQKEIRIQRKRFGQIVNRGIKTDHEEFNRRYVVICEDEAAAFEFLTPQVMETILKMDDFAGGKSSIYVKQDGTVWVAIERSKQILRSGDLNESIPKLRERMDDELRTVLMLPSLFLGIHENRI